MTDRTRVMILGAAGRDFHDFNTCFRDNDAYEVVAFTATQIPDIDDRRYPAALAGPALPRRHPHPRRGRARRTLIQRSTTSTRCVFAYSDVLLRARDAPRGARSQRRRRRLHDCSARGHRCSRSTKPVIAVCAVRTGCGKSQTSRASIATIAARGRQEGRRGPPPDALRRPRRPGACSASPRSPTSRSTTAPSRRWRSTSRTSPPAASSTPASTTRPSCARPRRRPTSSSGTAATTTCRFFTRRPVHRGRRPAPPGHELSLLPRRGRTCAWPTSSSSTRSTPPTAADIEAELRRRARRSTPTAHDRRCAASPIDRRRTRR